MSITSSAVDDWIGRAARLLRTSGCESRDERAADVGNQRPNSRGVGAADVDFWVGTGRMPAAVPRIEVGHRGAQLPRATIDARRVETLFRENCMHCHGASGAGAAIGDQ